MPAFDDLPAEGVLLLDEEVGLITDSAGPFNFDWAAWGEPRIH